VDVLTPTFIGLIVILILIGRRCVHAYALTAETTCVPKN
jgi:hypothetical protein